MNKKIILRPLFLAILYATTNGYAIANTEIEDNKERIQQAERDSRERMQYMLSDTTEQAPQDSTTYPLISKLQSFGLDVKSSNNIKINELSLETIQKISNWFIDTPSQIVDSKGNTLSGEDAKIYYVFSMLIKNTNNSIDELAKQRKNDLSQILSNFVSNIDIYYNREETTNNAILLRNLTNANKNNMFANDMTVLNQIEKLNNIFNSNNIKIKASEPFLLSNKDVANNINISKLASLIGNLPFYLVVDDKYKEGIFSQNNGPYGYSLKYSEYDVKSYPQSFFKLILLQNSIEQKSNVNAKLELIESTRLGNKTRYVDVVNDELKDIPVGTSRIIINHDMENLENLNSLAINNSIVYQTGEVGEISLSNNNISLFANPDTRITNLQKTKDNKITIHSTLEKSNINIVNKSEDPFTIIIDDASKPLKISELQNEGTIIIKYKKIEFLLNGNIDIKVQDKTYNTKDILNKLKSLSIDNQEKFEQSKYYEKELGSSF